ncbi:MAG: dihydrofolate reductase [Hyphomonadaceae bacterium]
MSPSTFPASSDRIGVRIVAATGRRGELGLNNQLLFRLKTDMANFRRITAATPLLMGRKTWDSFPRRPLPGRPNIVATRNLQFMAPGAHVYSSLPPALAAGRAMAVRLGASEVAVVGGADIYAAALPLATHMTLTEVDAEREADVFFPVFDRSAWREVSAVPVEADADNEYPFVIREYERQ